MEQPSSGGEHGGKLTRRLARSLAVLATLLFVVCIPLLLVTTNLRLAVNDQRLYEYGFSRYEVAAATGLSPEELSAAARQITGYFNSDEELLDIEFFGEREILHMRDVKGLVRLGYAVQVGSLSYAALFILAGFALRRGAFWRRLAGYLIRGSWLTIALIAVIGLWALVDFDSLFLAFHLAGFSNDLWQLSPADNLLLMFPQEFFNEAALFVAGATVLEAAVIGGISWGALRMGRKRSKVSPE